MSKDKVIPKIVQRAVFRKGTNMFLDVIQFDENRFNSDINGSWPTYGRVGRFIVDTDYHELRIPNDFELNINTNSQLTLGFNPPKANMVQVPGSAVIELLQAFEGPDHLLLEIKYTMSVEKVMPRAQGRNPANVLLEAWNNHAKKMNGE